MLSRDSMDYSFITKPVDYKTAFDTSDSFSHMFRSSTEFPNDVMDSDFYCPSALGVDEYLCSSPNAFSCPSKSVGLHINSFDDIYNQYTPLFEQILDYNIQPKYDPHYSDTDSEISHLDEFVDIISYLENKSEQDKFDDSICEDVKLTELEKYIHNVNENSSDGFSFNDIYAPDFFEKNKHLIENELPKPTMPKPLCLEHVIEPSLIDPIPDLLDKNTLAVLPSPEELNALCESIVLKPNIKQEVLEEDELELDILKRDEYTIVLEHSYFCKAEEDDKPVVKKRKKDDDDDDYNPNEKPKRKVGRPRIHKPNPPKTQRPSFPKTKAPKRVTQASKKLKSCSTVPFDRREQHNQAERERRDMLKKNLDTVEDITPGHVLELTQIALQSEKTSKSDEFENNENNFTVDVLKKLDELMKKEPTNSRSKNKKPSRKSKMVVLLGSTYYIGSLEKDLKIKENRLAQLKKQYEDCLRRFNPTKISKKVRRNYQ